MPLLERSAGGAEVLLGSPSGVVASGAVFGWVHERVLPEGGWRLAPAPLMAQLADAVAGLAAGLLAATASGRCSCPTVSCG